MALGFLLAGRPTAGAEAEPPADTATRRIIVGGDQDYPPYEYLDAEGQPTGFNVDLIRAVGETMGLEVSVELGSWPEVHRRFVEGHVDVLPLFYLSERDRTMDFSEAFVILYHEIFVHLGSPSIRSLDAMSGMEVIVQEDAFTQIQMEDHCPTARLVPVETEPEALRLLASGKHDCALVTQTGGRQAIRQYKLTNVVTSGPPRLPAEYCFAVKEGDAWLLSRLNEGLARVRASGRFGELHNKWLAEGPGEPVTWRTILWYASWVLLPLVVLAGLGFLWSWSLKKQVAERTQSLQTELAARHRAEARLLSYHRQLRMLASELSLAEEKVRHQVATELHDNVAQALAAIKVKAELLQKTSLSENAAGAAEEISSFAEEALKNTRNLMFDLSPPVLHQLGLAPALEWLAERVQSQHGIRVTVADDGRPRPLDEAVRIALFRSVSELLSNVVKHANARQVRLSLRRGQSKICIQVEDDGTGFDPAALLPRDDLAGGFGLFSIRERLDYYGGRLEIVSQPGKGTCVTLLAPLTPQGAA